MNKDKKIPTNWYVIITHENRGVIRNFWENKLKKSGYFFSTNAAYGYSFGDYHAAVQNDIDDYSWEKISFEDFKTHILKTDKIIGYKTPCDFYNGSVKKGTIIQELNTDNPTDRGEYQYENNDFIAYFPKEIVESWEAVYEVEEKIISVGGKFNVKIKGGKISHGGSDITAFVEGLVKTFGKVYEFGGFPAVIDDITFRKTGCEVETTTLKDWKGVYDAWRESYNG